MTSSYREHRTVCLPDFQGVGLGNAMSEYIASIFLTKQKPYTSVTSHPAMMRHRSRSPLWKMTRRPSITSPYHAGLSKGRNKPCVASGDRVTASFRYVGPAADPQAARQLLNS